jgi:hypothetical protein
LKQQAEVQKAVRKRFFLEFVPLLGPRQKWSQEQENLNVDDVVIELDDGLLRKVEVTSTDNKIYIRPISKLIPNVRN